MDRAVMERLLRRAYLYDDPAAYRAGVEAAWRALAAPAPAPPPSEPRHIGPAADARLPLASRVSNAR